VARAFSM